MVLTFLNTYKVRHEEADEALVKGIKDRDPERGGNINLQGNSSVSLVFSNKTQKHKIQEKTNK